MLAVIRSGDSRRMEDQVRSCKSRDGKGPSPRTLSEPRDNRVAS